MARIQRPGGPALASEAAPPGVYPADPVESSAPRWRGRIGLCVLAVTLLFVLFGGGLVLADYWLCLPESTRATYVGSKSCAECHQEEYDQWIGSHHERAMDVATEKTVLGDFHDAELTHFGVTSRMFRDGDKFMIHTEGPDGEMADFEVKYVFGYHPLQQYMVEFDRGPQHQDNELARLQVLRVSWDVENEEWFYLLPPDVNTKMDADDPLHWTRMGQNWNHMCADCHSTNLYKNHDPGSNAYHTHYSEISVGCEACHGPGSVHNELAQANSLFWDRRHGYGLADLKSADGDIMMHACFRCHSRRRIFNPHFQAGEDFYDYFANELLSPTTYHNDGQILDEVYVHGSFIQSKMYAKGVRCTDCHNPHTAKVKYDGNKLCTSCHMDTHPAGKYDTASHHYHKADGTGALCVECHMPESTYMMVDPRRDHSFKVPRPDLSLKYGTPNTCTRCHLDRAKIAADRPHGPLDYQAWLLAARNGDEEVRRALREIDQWSMDWMIEWYGDDWTTQPEHASTLAAAWADEPAAVRGLADLARDKQAPPMIRATAVHEFGRFHLNDELRQTTLRALRDPSPQVRAAAIATLEPMVRRISALLHALQAPDPNVRAEARRQLAVLPQNSVLRDLKPMLSDPSRLVRTDAARILAALPAGEFSTDEEREALENAFAELVVSLEANSDQSGAHTTLASIYEQSGKWRKAVECYRKAIYVQDDVVGPRTNLAALLDQMGEHDEATQLRREELKLLQRDVRLLKESGQENAGLLYRLGMSLYLHDRFDEAERALRRAHELEPQTPDFAAALALFCEKFERWDEAITYCRKYLELQPQDRQYQQLLKNLERRASEK